MARPPIHGGGSCFDIAASSHEDGIIERSRSSDEDSFDVTPDTLIEVIPGTPPPGDGDEEARSVDRGDRRTAALLLLGGALIGIVVATVVGSLVGDDDQLADTDAAVTIPELDEIGAVEQIGEELPVPIDFEPVPDLEPTSIVGASHVRAWTFWRLDLAAGTGRQLTPAGGLQTDQIVDIRFLDGGHAVAQFADDTIGVLDVNGGSITMTRRVDIGDRLLLGLDGLTPDGSAIWIGARPGLLLWRLADDEVVDRWLDLDGDLGTLPTIEGAADRGVVVSEGGRVFLVADGAANPLDIEGTVVDVSSSWVLTRVCTDELRCNRLVATNLDNGAAVEFAPEERFIDHCGVMSDHADGSLEIVMQRFGSSSLFTVSPSSAVEIVDLHPGSVGCIGVTTTNDVVTVFHERGFTVVTETGPVFRQLEGLRPIAAAAPA